MRIGIVGCGYVADFYAKTLGNHPQLAVSGVYDRDAGRAAAFSAHHGMGSYDSLSRMLEDRSVDLVLNLTNPSSHFEVSRVALEAGKHVYSEKPLATDLASAAALVELAERRGLILAGAPCGVLGEAAQTVWKLLRQGALGKVRLAYADLDEGPIHLTNFRDWRSDSGAPWPFQDEFETGVTLEHAGYYVTWLAAFFGPARRVTAFAASVAPNKGVQVNRVTPDFTVGCIEFASGPVARLTCSLFAPHDHALRIFGDAGTLDVKDCWDYGSRVRLRRRTPLGLKAEKHAGLARLVGLGAHAVQLVRRPPFRLRTRGANQMDFARGIAEVADALLEQRPCRLSARFALHVNEIVLAIQDPAAAGSPYQVKTTFEAMAPMPWSD